MYKLYFDGCENGCASIITKEGIEMDTIMYHGQMNSTESLLTGLCLGLEYCIRKCIQDLVICGENYVIMEQLQGKNKLHHELCVKAKRLLGFFQTVQFKIIFRHENRRATQLSKEASLGI
jgi:hypothetical protein